MSTQRLIHWTIRSESLYIRHGMDSNDPAQRRHLAAISRVFTPSTPVTEAAVFSGRGRERERLIRAVFEPGRHAVVYGARGVGKTSLVNVVGASLSEQGGAASDEQRVSVRVPCTREDTFDSVWRQLARDVSVVPIIGAETTVKPLGERHSLDVADAIADHPGIVAPADIERVFRHAARAVLVFDEFDTLIDRETRSAFADTIKMLSDSGTGPTVVLVGVGADIGTLIEDHESIQRCVQQIHMPAMSEGETRSLVVNGFALLDDLDIESAAVDQIARFSRGFPSFAHSLAKEAASITSGEGRTSVGRRDVFAGAVEALAGIPYSLGETYRVAVDVRHPTDTTAVTLAAAAYAGPDRFRPTEVQAILASWGVNAQLQTVTNRLRSLCKPSRGSVLRTTGGGSHPAYEFSDPMMPPYVVIRNAERRPAP